MAPDQPVIRRLMPDDAGEYRTLRLRALRDHPDAFTSSFEEEQLRPLAWAQARLRPDAERPHDFFLGAFIGDELVGMVGLQGRYRPKERHNAAVVGMYVAPDAAG
ncbi:MAG: GNAT family N-acetyltransferase, partial [Burkholderiaceae bacterium]|nr:GNAT family N-acetyltransferase [Burkholderiaceae bacterium]